MICLGYKGLRGEDNGHIVENSKRYVITPTPPAPHWVIAQCRRVDRSENILNF